MQRRIAFTAALLFVAACADGTSDAPAPDLTPAPDPALSDLRPVDMLYHATVIQGESDCGGSKIPEGTATDVDAYLQADGKLLLSIENFVVPGSATYENVVRQGSRVDHTKEETDYSGKFVHHVTGVLDPDHIDLTIKGQAHGWDAKTNTAKACTNTVQLKGKARPLLDPRALDGRYTVVLTGSYVCPGKPDIAIGSADMPLDVGDDPAKSYVSFTLNGSTSFALKRSEDAKRATGQGMYSVYDATLGDRIGTVRGNAAPDAMDLHIELVSDSAGPCVETYMVKGAKVIPAFAKPENRYRVKYAYKTDCDGASMSDVQVNESAMDVLRTAKGLTIMEFGMATPITQDGEAFKATATLDDGGTLTYAGTLKAGSITYTVSATHPYTASGTPCTEHVDATGKPRFVFP